MKKKIMSFSILLAVIFSISTIPVQAKTKQVTLYVGKTVSLEEKGDVKWSSEDSTIAKVSQRGKVTAVKKGTVNIMALNGNEKQVYKIIVKNAYYKADFSKAKKMIKRNLTNGKAKKLAQSDIKALQKKINKCNFYKKTPLYNFLR